MQKYSSINSGIDSFEIVEDFIKVNFKKRGPYTYSTRKNDFEIIDRMKELAIEQRGLNTFINQRHPEPD